MSGERADPREEMRRLIAEDAPSPDDHPDPGELVDYHERRLSGARADEVQEHLAACPECASLVLEYARDWAPEAVRGGGSGVADGAFEAPWHRRVGVWQALAAALAAVALGLGLWTALGEPERDGAIRGSYTGPNLSEESSGPRGGPGETLRVPAWAREVTLLLNVEEVEPEAEYGVHLIADGRVVKRARGIRGTPEEALSIVVDADLLGAGRYEIALFRYGEGAAAAEPVGHFPFTVEAPEAGAEP